MRKTYSFKLDEKKDVILIDKIDHIVNKSAFFREILKMYFDEKIKPVNPLDDKIKKEKLTLLRMEKSHKVRKIQETISKTKLNTAQCNFIETYGRPISSAGRLTLKEQTIPKAPHNDILSHQKQNCLQCGHCGILFQYDPMNRYELAETKEHFIEHYHTKHNAGLTNQEIHRLQQI